MLHPTPLKIHTPRRDMPGVLAASPPLTAYPGSHQKCESRGLWDEVENLHVRWTELGKPTRERFGLTVARGEHTLWLDDPRGPDRWTL